MQTIAIKTAQNIDIDYEVAGLGERVIARVIDYGLFLAVWLLYLLVVSDEYYQPMILYFTLPQIIYFIFFAFYDLICEVWFNGQSLGKFIMKIRVISLDGGRPSIGQYLLRYFFRMADFALFMPGVAIISIALTKNKQRVGDIVANTTLIRTKPTTGIEQLYESNVDAEYQPVYLEALSITDKDLALMQEVLSHFFKTGDTTFIDALAERVSAHLKIQITEGTNKYKFLETLVKDHYYLALNLNSQMA